ncbi:hypothetical protein [Bacillus sp. COPE52]|uniref:hypothetical protein n=1 Tax=Bacillus sp. COPE52 TaxID=2233998 RepID=UPI001ABEF7B5|nr:hypothetical protein [Bacillus sp. COPE52]
MTELLWQVKYIHEDGRTVDINMLNATKNGIILSLSMFHSVKELISIEEIR